MRIYDNGTYRDMTEEEINEYNKLNEESAELTKAQAVEDMKQDLASSDYKITKSMEYFLVGLLQYQGQVSDLIKELPYDIVALHEERQNKRDKINEKSV